MTRRIVVVPSALFSAVVLLGVLSGSLENSAGPVSNPAPGSVYPDDILSRSSAMTQEMSAPAPLSGHEYHWHASDEQLRLSSDPEFVRELEAYQHRVDRMLARTP